MHIWALSSIAKAYDDQIMHDRSKSVRPESDFPPAGEPTAAWASFVRQRRIHLRLRQDELAALAGVSTRSVHAIESGKATARLDVLLAVINTLGLKLSLASPLTTVEITDRPTSATVDPNPAPMRKRTRKPSKAARRG
jgi:HTH-type transcriptional regulator / antitoxin HipB